MSLPILLSPHSSDSQTALPQMLFPAMLGSGSQEEDVALDAQPFPEVTSWYLDSGEDHFG